MQRTEIKKRTVVILADYDGCFDILFDEILELYKNDPEIIELLLLFRKQLLDYLDETTRGADVEFYAHSNRASIPCDEEGHRINGNGLCLRNYPKFCKERGYLYRELLYTDIQLGLEPGTAFKNRNLDYTGGLGDKRVLLQGVLKDIEKNHAEKKEVEVYAFDDLFKDVLFPLVNHFQQDDNRKTILDNICLTPVFFNRTKWMINRKKPEDTVLRELAKIWGMKKRVVPEVKIPLSLNVTVPLEFNTAELKEIPLTPLSNAPEVSQSANSISNLSYG